MRLSVWRLQHGEGSVIAVATQIGSANLTNLNACIPQMGVSTDNRQSDQTSRQLSLLESESELTGDHLAVHAVAEDLVEQSEIATTPTRSTPLPPMMQQYLNLKREYPQHILLYQVGDFYEIFFDDARIASEILNIRLTARNKDQADPIPMCGVPIHAIDNYLPKLLQAGQSCVLMSQVEEDKPNGKNIVKREITRIVTPGVRYDGDGLDNKHYNFLAAVVLNLQNRGAVAYTDVSTGDLRLQEIDNESELLDLLESIRPAEVIVPTTLYNIPVEAKRGWLKDVRKLAKESNCHLVLRPFEKVTSGELERRLADQQSLSAVSTEARSAIAVILNYVDEVSFGRSPRLGCIALEKKGNSVVLDAATRRNLELLETAIDGENRNSLLHRMDYTRTCMGARMLRDWILAPSCSREEISSRHEAVAELYEESSKLEQFNTMLCNVRDLDRLLSRVSTLRANPRDLALLADSIAELPQIKLLLSSSTSKLLKDLTQRFDPLEDLWTNLSAALKEDAPTKSNEGDIFRDGFDPEVDRLRALRKDGGTWLADFEQRERQRTGIAGLKVRYNNVFGYYIELSKLTVQKTPESALAGYDRKQTLANAERFVTTELKNFELEILSAKSRLIDLERALFIQLREKVAVEVPRIQQVSRQLATIDVLQSYAILAREHSYVRPKLVDDSRTHVIGGRHPVVERVIGQHNFVANDINLNTVNRRFAVLTGPNMGGKSTYLRQIGLIQLLAQAGSFVPARSAELGLVDRIFTRIGGADNLTRGDSTFMVEMREAATILQRASSRSLVLIDEIGRGTATTDGLAIATAIAECLHDEVGCRTVFATHFHELTELPNQKSGAFSISVGVTEGSAESGGEISFTHRIEEKPADRSYGIEVARLAGLPPGVLTRARTILDSLEEDSAVVRPKPIAAPNLKSEVEKVEVSPQRHSLIEAELAECDLNSLTPVDALVKLSELQKSLLATSRKYVP